MNKIIILSQEISEKIAAGEVVERPASAIKELIENSIDANSTKITIDIENKGIDLIQITDDGDGMTKEDLEICLTRHATSKIKKIEDLETIKTMGFRGEALAAISRVSKIEITTKQQNNELGFYLYAEGGEIKQIKQSGAKNGTKITIKDLFYNTPARKKFLKSNSSENSAIISIVEKISLSHENITFVLNIDGKNKINLIKTDDKLERIKDIFGKEVKEKLIKIDSHNEFISISGYISSPDLIEKNKNYYSFVNKRSILSKIIIASVNEAYKEAILKSRYPLVFLFIEMSGEYFDVNVHPQKTEIKFIDESAIFSLIKNTISANLSHDKKIKLNITDKTETIVQEKEIKKESEITPPKIKQFDIKPFYKKQFFESIEKTYSFKENYPQEKINEKKKESENLIQFNMRIIGWLPTKFILAYNEKNDLLIIDQHAAHERINYEILLNDFNNNKIEVQGLLIPEIIQIQKSKIDFVLNNISEFEKFGFYLEHFGDIEFKINAVPSIINKGSEKIVFKEILENIDNQNIHSQEIVDKIIMSSCKNSIKANQKLSLEEMQTLIKSLLQAKNPYHCPHGRPTIINITENEIDKKFGRINV